MRTPFNLTGIGIVDKERVASELGLIHTLQEFMLCCGHEPHRGIYDERGEYITDTIGHVFTAEMIFFDGEWGHDRIYLDDRDGDLRLQLAKAVEIRATAMLEVATALRQHHAEEQAQKKRPRRKVAN